MNFNTIEKAFLPEILRLNNKEVPHVNELTLDALSELCNDAAFAQVSIDEYAISGVVLGFVKEAEYQGFNYHWFCERYDNFLYIDRIIVNHLYRGNGVGKALYRHADAFCRLHGLTSICCEVNETPPNPVSHDFHLKAGFDAVEAVLHPEGKTVIMYRKLI